MFSKEVSIAAIGGVKDRTLEALETGNRGRLREIRHQQRAGLEDPGDMIGIAILVGGDGPFIQLLH